MRLYYRAGDRTTALRQFERCASAVAEQFSVEPSRATVSLYQQVRTDSLDDERPARTLSVAESSGEPIGRQQARLDELQDSVSSLQRQMQQQVTMIKDIQASLSSLHLIARSRALAEGHETARQTT